MGLLAVAEWSNAPLSEEIINKKVFNNLKIYFVYLISRYLFGVNSNDRTCTSQY